MSVRILYWFSLTILPLWIGASQSSATTSLMIRNVTIIDGTGRAPVREMSLVVSDGRIAAIGAASKIKAPAGVTVIDGTGKFLIPGLWKMHDGLPRDIYLSVAKQARESRISFVGHIPPTVLPEEASNLGQRSIEHLGGRFWGVLLGASKLEAELHADEVRLYERMVQAVNSGGSPPDLNMRAEFTRRVVESYDRQKAAGLIRKFRRNDTWQCPTLVALRTLWTGGGAQYSREDL